MTPSLGVQGHFSIQGEYHPPQPFSFSCLSTWQCRVYSLHRRIKHISNEFRPLFQTIFQHQISFQVPVSIHSGHFMWDRGKQKDIKTFGKNLTVFAFDLSMKKFFYCFFNEEESSSWSKWSFVLKTLTYLKRAIC